MARYAVLIILISLPMPILMEFLFRKLRQLPLDEAVKEFVIWTVVIVVLLSTFYLSIWLMPEHVLDSFIPKQ